MSIAPPPHRRHLPDVPINERGMRQLEIWLRDMMRTLIAKGANFDGYIRFNRDNQGPNEGTGKRGYLDITANGTDANGYGIYLNDDTGVNGMLLEAEVAVTIRDQDDQDKIIVHDDVGGLTFYSNDNGMWFDDHVKADRTTNPNNGIQFYTPSDMIATVEDNVIFNLFPSTGEDWRIVQSIHNYTVEGDDTADSYITEVHYTNGGNFTISTDITNAPGAPGGPGTARFETGGGSFEVDASDGKVEIDGGYLDVATVDDNAGVGINLVDNGATGGINIESVNGNVGVAADAGQVNLGAPGATFSLGATNSSMQILNLGDTFIIYDSGGSPLVTYTG